MTARVWFLLTSACSCAGILLILIYYSDPAVSDGSRITSRFAEPSLRMLNQFALFSILSNILAAITGLAEAAPAQLEGRMRRVLLHTTLSSIVLTAIVYHVALASHLSFTGVGWIATQLMHTVAPVLCIAGWLIFSSHRRLDVGTLILSTALPMIWLLLTLLRGGITGWYPYAFLDASALGYPLVLLASFGLVAAYLMLGSIILWIDRAISPSRDPAPAD